jgi:hypothetical protein
LCRKNTQNINTQNICKKNASYLAPTAAAALAVFAGAAVITTGSAADWAAGDQPRPNEASEALRSNEGKSSSEPLSERLRPPDFDIGGERRLGGSAMQT